MATKKFQVWKTIKLGTGLKTDDDFCQKLEAKGNNVSKFARSIMKKSEFTVSQTEIEIDLVVVSGEELGFDEVIYCSEIYTRAVSLGLDLVPAEVGPQLRLQYQNQPLRELLHIAMKPIRNFDGSLDVFDIFHVRDGLCLEASFCNARSPARGHVFAFRK